jgi:alpha-galactosidase
MMFCLCLAVTRNASSQTIIPLETAHNVILLGSDKTGNLGIFYFGRKLDNFNEYNVAVDIYKNSADYTGLLNSAYTPSGSRNLAEPAISVTHSDGNKSFELKYISHKLLKINADV